MRVIPDVLAESFSLLLEKPKLFLPKLVSTLTASLFMVLLLSRLNSGSQPSPVFTAMIFPGLVLISLLGVYSSMMLSSMVMNSDGSLRRSFRDVGGSIRNVALAAAGFVLLGFMISTVPLAGYIAYIVSGNLAALLAGVLSFIVVVLAVSYASYFLPVTLLERKGIRSAVKGSYTASEQNRSAVIGLLLFSLVLVAVAVSSTGYLEKLGYVGFVAGRLVSSVVNTYVFTVSPAYYMESRGENVD